jgi:hypothetical protein
MATGEHIEVPLVPHGSWRRHLEAANAPGGYDDEDDYDAGKPALPDDDIGGSDAAAAIRDKYGLAAPSSDAARPRSGREVGGSSVRSTGRDALGDQPASPLIGGARTGGSPAAIAGGRSPGGGVDAVLEAKEREI